MPRQTVSRARRFIIRPGNTAAGPSHTAAGAIRHGWHRYVPLWLGLLAFTAIVTLNEEIPIAAPNPPLAFAAATLAGTVGAVLFYLGSLRFLRVGRPLDLFTGCGFGALAIATITIRIVIPATRATPALQDAGLGVLLFVRALAAGLFFIPLLHPQTVIPLAGRRRYAARAGAAVGLLTTVGVATIVAVQDRLPPAISPQARALLEAQVPIVGALPGQATWLLVANAGIVLLMSLATIAYAARAGQDDPYPLAPVIPFTLLTFGQFHALLFPPAAPDYVSTALVLRLGAYFLLLGALVAQAGRDLGQRVADEERRRLSRELHDGLMQQLSLLSLRLNRARQPGRGEVAREHDLAAAARVLEAAMIEARQAIVALRSGVVAWDDFTRALGAFADEFGENHELVVELRASADGCALDAGLQAEILRILHEACSNAIRHGGASRVTVVVSADDGWLTVQARDDGRGFATNCARGGDGVGLQSLEERVERRGGWAWIESAPGAGTTVGACLPLDTPRRSMA